MTITRNLTCLRRRLILRYKEKGSDIGKDFYRFLFSVSISGNVSLWEFPFDSFQYDTVLLYENLILNILTIGQINVNL